MIPEVADPFSGGGFSNHFTALDYQKDKVNAFVGSLGDNNVGRYRCARSCGLTLPILTMKFVQTRWPWRPRHRRAIVEIRLHLQDEHALFEQHLLLDKRAFHPRSPPRSAPPILEHLADFR